MNSTQRAVGRYHVEGELGRGGMAVVYLARQLDLDRSVALKELALLPTSDASIAKRFLREARLAGSLSHPNIVTVYEYFEHDGTPYIAMEYMPRGALRRYVGRLTMGQIGAVLEGTLAGLGHAASRQIVHRDIKPENIMISAEGGAKIADFGIATATNAVRSAASMTAPGTAIGTPNYMAPEQATAQPVGPATDLYAVGIMAFELFAGRPPFANTDDPLGVLMRQVSEPVPPLRVIVPSIDLGVSNWVERMLMKDPRMRPRSATDAWAELDERMIALLGPRWRRETRAVGGAGTAGGPGAQNVRRAFATPATVGVVDASERAPTIMPKTLQGNPPATATPRRNTLRTAAGVFKGVVAIALAATLAAAALHLPHRGGGSTRATEASLITPAAPHTQPSTTAPSANPVGDLNVPSTSPGSGLDTSSLPKQAPVAQKLAKSYAAAADRTAALPGQTASIQQLTLALRAAAAAYHRAAQAAARNDMAAFVRATKRIDISKQLVRLRVAAISHGGATGKQQGGGTQSQTTGGCVGDSRSDDPSDDSCSDS
jgi:Protein kinase domain